MKMISKG